jgi:hypothetical protein
MVPMAARPVEIAFRSPSAMAGRPQKSRREDTSAIPGLTLSLQSGDTWLGLAANSVGAHTLSVTTCCHLAVTAASPAYRPGPGDHSLRSVLQHLLRCSARWPTPRAIAGYAGIVCTDPS